MAAGPDLRPWWKRIPAVLAYPLSVGGILTCVFLGFLNWIGRAVSAFGAVSFTAGGIILGLTVVTVFNAIRASADGSTTLPDWADVRSVREDVIFPGVKAVVLAAVLFVPVIALAIAALVSSVSAHANAAMSPASLIMPGSKGADPLAELQKLSGSGLPSMPAGLGGENPWPGATATAAAAATATPEPTPSPSTLEEVRATEGMAGAFALIALGAGAAFLYPLALLMLAITGSLLAALNPAGWIHILRRAGGSYVGAFVGLLGLGALSSIVALPLRLLGTMPMLPSIAANTIDVYFALCSAHLLGWFLWQNHAALGYQPNVRQEMDLARVQQIKDATRAEVMRYGGRLTPGPQAGTASATAGGAGGTVVAGAGAGVAVQEPAFDADETAGLAARFSSACASRDLASAMASAPLLVDAYLLADQAASAIGVYGQLVALDPDASLDPARQTRIARACEEAGQWLPAASAWRALALRYADAPQAPSALFRCGECYAKAGQAEWAKKAFQIFLQRYPMDPTVGAVQARLKALG